MITPVLRLLRFAFVVIVGTVATAPASAHDLERTNVTLTFARDGSFVLDVANDPDWLLLRLEPFADAAGLKTRTTTIADVVPAFRPAIERDARLASLGRVFVDRVVLFVDGHEVRPASAEYMASLATYRLRGRMPVHAQSLRWYYGLVIDPYPLTIRRADHRSITEWIAGDAWSRSLDVSGQFRTPRDTRLLVLVVALFLMGLIIRVAGSRSRPAHRPAPTIGVTT
jgi:hypothetical protein